ncbi:methionyl-tRNA formyltransferase [Helicobacter marmotae]|uniref:Methionyl-tRNA formyltransferase n=1 Tax=Helicobacter marmotae TaxID=152490 RepID=A0A3D8I5Y0_9HELI|nr:methionyl-tRNA formyltransferase [Helicobacter marmotae]RDU60154.1 methionyl-tRNA formyltransferase [Helicobacter marmotae]
MRLICAGTPAFATHIFSHLSKEHEILALICQPDKPFGRKGELKPPHTKESLGHIGIPILQPSHIDEPFIAHIRALKPDMIIVVAYGQILPTAFLKIAPCINIHASILPKWRGASPLQQMIMSKEPYFGISAMLMNERLDSGEILGLSYIENTQQDINKLSLELASLGAKLALYVIAHFQSIEPIKQIDADASYCTKIKKSDGYIEFDCASKIYSAYLAYCTWPHIFIKSTHGYTLKLFDVSLIESSSSHKAGEILQIESPYIIVGCTQGSLRIGALQQEGKNKLEAATYLRGKHLKMGDILC